MAMGRTAAVQERVNRVSIPIEGIALCDEVGQSVVMLDAAITGRSWQAVFDERSRLGRLVESYRAEFRRLAGAIEGEAA